ncbi:RNA polymerase sigma factor, partial [Streptomyces mirabilis]
MCRTPHWVPVPESSERGRPARDGFPIPAVPPNDYGMDSGEAVDPIPDVPLPHASAATFLEVAPVQTQTLTQTDNLTDADTDAEPDVVTAVPPQRGAA